MPFPFVDLGFWYFLRILPPVVRDVEDIVVVEYILVVSSVYQYFISVNFHLM